MKLSEVKGEAALDLLGDIIEPISSILADPEVQKAVKNSSKMAVIKLLLKEHKKAVIEIMAAMDGVPVNEYEVNILTLPLKLLDIINDEELISFFTSADSIMDQTPSIDTSENTTGPEE